MAYSKQINPDLRPASERPDKAAWFTTPETGDYLGLTAKTLSNMRSLGTGPIYHKHGNKVWYQGADIIAWSQRRRYIGSGQRDEQ